MNRYVRVTRDIVRPGGDTVMAGVVALVVGEVAPGVFSCYCDGAAFSARREDLSSATRAQYDAQFVGSR